MAKKNLYKERLWKVFFAVLASGLSLLVIYLSPENRNDFKQSTPPVINNVSNITHKEPVYHSHKKVQAGKVINSSITKQPIIPEQYVEVYLNINSDDKILINGKPASAERSERPSTLKLVRGNTYMIKINNCPEIQIVAEKDMTISTCM